MSNQFSDFWLSCIINGTFIQNVDTRFSVLLNVDGFLLRIGELVSYLGRKIILGSSKEHTSILRKNGLDLVIERSVDTLGSLVFPKSIKGILNNVSINFLQCRRFVL